MPFIGDKPHSCKHCHKRFALACNLRAHLKTHEGKSVQYIIQLYVFVHAYPIINISKFKRGPIYINIFRLILWRLL